MQTKHQRNGWFSLLIVTGLFLTIACHTHFDREASPAETTTRDKPSFTTEAPPVRPRLRKERPISILTYNICWECMTHSRTLGASCSIVSGQKTICTQNVAEIIKKAAEDYGDLDFIALQEATHHEIIEQDVPTVFSNFDNVSHKSGLEEQTTYYNKNMYTLWKKITGEFQSGRPYQILLFTQKVILVNLHNGHTATREKMELALSKGLTAHLTQEEITSLQSYRIILAGDFNDHHTALRKLAPFSYAGISTEVSLKISSPPNTCCTNPGTAGHTSAIDYILDSNPSLPIRLEIPAHYEWKTPASDHLPVIGVLPHAS